jgi:transcriptional regulator with PAS, ATPase and Fis domain
MWFEEFDGSVTVCNPEGVVTYMNDTSKKQFIKYGGGNLVGTNILDCHPEPARSKLVELLKTQTVNTYTTEKEGIKKIIHQSPLFENGVFSGFIEISFDLPQTLTHFIRD